MQAMTAQEVLREGIVSQDPSPSLLPPTLPGSFAPLTADLVPAQDPQEEEPLLCFPWSDGEFADCQVTLAGKNYRLHRQLLAKGPRSCGFFEGAFREGGLRPDNSVAVDLTALLPEACHPHFEAALGFIYGQRLDFSAESVALLFKIGDVLQGSSLMRASVSAMEGLYRDDPGWRTAVHFLELGTTLGCEGIVHHFLPRVVRVGTPRDASHSLLTAACARFPTLAATLLADISEGSGWRWDAAGITARPADTCALSHAQVAFSAEGAARLAPDIDGARTCAVVAVSIKCGGPTIGVSATCCDLLSQRHADGGFARVAGGWGLSLTSGGLWAEGRRVGQVPPEFRSSLVGTRISMRLDPVDGLLTFTCEEWTASIKATFPTGTGLRFTAYACCGGTAFALT